jgi:hypothetical protein
MAKIYYDGDADLRLLKGRGGGDRYGWGHAHANPWDTGGCGGGAARGELPRANQKTASREDAGGGRGRTS